MFLRGSRAGLGPEAFFSSHENLWPLVLPVAAVQKIRACPEGTSWSSVSKELNLVISSSLLGERLLGFAGKLVAQEQISEVIRRHAEKLLALDKIDEHVLASAKSAAMEDIMKVPTAKLSLDQKRQVSFEYRGWKVVTEAGSTAQHLDFAMQAALRGYGAATGELPLLPAEGFLCPTTKDAEQSKIQASLLGPAIQARKVVGTLLSTEECASGESLKDRRGVASIAFAWFSRCQVFV